MVIQRNAYLTLILLGATCVWGAANPLSLVAQQVEVSSHFTTQVEEEISALAFSAAGDRLLVGGEDGGLVLLDVEAERTIWRSRSAGGRPIHLASFLSGDSAVVTVDEDGRIELRHVDREAEATALDGGIRPERAALDSDLWLLALAGQRQGIGLFDLKAGARMATLEGDVDLDELLFLGFDARGRQLLAADGRGRGAVWSAESLELLRQVTLESDELHGSRSVVHALGQDRRANILVVALQEVALPRGGLRGRARPGDLVRQDQLVVFDWHSGAEIRRVNVVDGAADHLVVGPGNDHALVARGADVTVMDLRRGDRGAAITAPGEVRRMAISPDQDWLAVGSADGNVSLWAMDYREPQLADLLDGPQEGIGGRIRVLGDDAPIITPDEPAIMAVLPFDDRDGEGRMSQTVAELLVTQLANLEHLTLVERMRIDDLLAEQELQRQGVTEDGGMELGQMLNADYVLLGSIGASGSSVTFSARLLDVASGEVVSGRQVLCEECRAQDLFDAIHLLGGTIAR